uniref:Metalloendopeptidase n=1 Tax=Strongyloides papillosus TaxID=174720 RepID=A0A0N5B6E7_STREA
MLLATRKFLRLFTLFILFVNVISSNNSNSSDESSLNSANDAAELKFLLHEIKAQSAKKFGIFSDSLIDAGAQDMKKVTFNDGTEASVNRKVSDDLFENDILLNIEQANEILNEVKSTRRVSKRQAQPGLKFLWTNKNINYIFAYTDYTWQNLIRSALSHIEKETCMRFSENNGNYDKLQFIRGSGCWSNVGRQGGRQQVSIGYGCDSVGIIAHETLHALGLWHEQSRYDRDDYVRIDWTKIFRGTQSNFEKRTPATSDNMDMPYDLGSVMHYGSKAFSTDWSTYSIITKDSLYQQTIGQRKGISFKDARMINLRYCMDVCRTQLNCMNGGYTDPNSCYECRCPPGYTGRLCNKVRESNFQSCRGGEFRASENWQTITSPYLLATMNCFWRITAPRNNKIQLKFEKINFPCSDVCDNYVEVKYLADKTTTGARMCCTVPSKIIETKEVGTDIILNLVGDPSVQNGYQGFIVKYRILSKGNPNKVAITTTSNKPRHRLNKNDKKTINKKTTRRNNRTNNRVKYSKKNSPRRDPLIRSATTHSPTLFSRVASCSQNKKDNSISLDNHKLTNQNQKINLLPNNKDLIGILSQNHSALILKNQTIIKTVFAAENPDGGNGGNTGNLLTTTKAPERGSWSAWGEWSTCSHSCGGCGTRVRVRACYPEPLTCDGNVEDSEPCNPQVCKKIDTKKNQRCMGRLVMPCDLMEQLDFGTTRSNDMFRVGDIPHLPTNSKNIHIINKGKKIMSHRKKRFVDGDKQMQEQSICEKRFTYNCPTNLLTINVDWKKPNDDYQTGACCSGYKPNQNNICVPA